ncbi:hypothetical protein N7470_000136 [Penicillium chermesinum]|nr:hypothetical protein N7470_000136 [Penicillium chermesinum]
MAPLPRADMLAKDKFSYVFGGARIQSYNDPAARGPGSHTIRSLAWNPLGQLIATGSADRTLRIWNPERAAARYSTELRGHSAAVEAVHFNPVRDAELASCSADGTVRFWDVRSKNCVSRLDVGGEAFTLSWSVDGSTMVVGRKVRDLQSPGTPLNVKPTNNEQDDILIPIEIKSPSTPTILPNGSSDSSKTTSTYTALSQYPPECPDQRHDVLQRNEDPNLYFFATTGEGDVKIMTVPSFETVHTLKASTCACAAVSMAPSGRYLAIGSSDSLITLWDTTDWHCCRGLEGGANAAIRGVSWSFDGRFLCGASDEPGTGGHGLDIFYADTGEIVHTVPPTGANATIPAVAWHPSRYWLAYSTTNDGPSGTGGLKIVGAGSTTL